MRFVSTRDSNNIVDFKQALLDCMPADGGLYVPCECEDLRKWILYADERTSFANLAGTLTSALVNREFSPIICEAIATRAFPFEPVMKQLDDNLFALELYHGPTGTFKDFGVAYLTAALETVLQMNGERAIFLDATSGELGACMAHALRGKRLVKSVLLCPKGKFRGMDESDFVWNGGNIYPIEVDGTEADCHNLIRRVFADRELVKKYHLSVANTANIGRLLPQAFFYTYAFTRIKKIADGDIYYAVAVGNYGNIVSGLYSWRLALPVNGFIVPETADLRVDAGGNIEVVDSIVPLGERPAADPADPSNLERMENIFNANSLMLRSFVYPAAVSPAQTSQACRDLFQKYKVYADSQTSSAYAAAQLRKDVTEDEDGAVVIVARNAPALDEQFIRHNLGEAPDMDGSIAAAFKPVSTGKAAIAANDFEQLISVLNFLNQLRVF
ncbi:MAG: pyridoxal-phosphate dependent enzyme [Treponema sp.]|jgi:threonine synthase|nr:pyridoxal-phosphate dependent enzyme [Treponema sp.]